MVRCFWRGLRDLPHLPVRAQQLRQFYPIQIGSDVAPRVPAGLFNDSLQHQRQYTQGDVGVNATIQYDISGDQGGTWCATIKDGKCTVTSGASPDPTLTLTM